jgi:hypothetical protein
MQKRDTTRVALPLFAPSGPSVAGPRSRMKRQSAYFRDRPSPNLLPTSRQRALTICVARYLISRAWRDKVGLRGDEGGGG